MSQVFGPLTPFGIMLLVTLLTEYVKRNWTLSPRGIQLVALGFSIILIGIYELLTAQAITPLIVFGAVIYALFGWMTAIGMYEVATKQIGNGNG